MLKSLKPIAVQLSGRNLSDPNADWSVDPDEVDIFRDQPIGKGGFGEVYVGKWDDQLYGTLVDVAIIHSTAVAELLISSTDDEGQPNITDFGMAFIKTLTKTNTDRQSFAVRWVGPERYQRGYRPVPATDVFSFAMTAYEILTGTVPFAEERIETIVKDWIRDGERPNRPEGVSDTLWDIIVECWHQDPAQRPKFADVVRRIQDLPSKPPRMLVPELAPQYNVPETYNLDQVDQQIGFSK
eukprot:jgi/Hompol1/4142/HPOL_006941-RA